MISENKKEHILTNALALIKQSGVIHTTMDMVAAQSGVSKKTLYAYFSNKKVLLAEALEMEATLLRQELDKPVYPKMSLTDYWCRTLHIVSDRLSGYSPQLMEEFTDYFPLKHWADEQKKLVLELILKNTTNLEVRQKVEILFRSFLALIGRSIVQKGFYFNKEALEKTVIPFYCKGVE
ncbi:AcrR family transcriptional regulator [Catalinimonas alkaloidigena]|uniref:TetR/AcrR family transcriptional regulator n=1 Tax=Catalinimonas alkaloidigena TaxID=1075417 RepID=UPI0024066ADF|nr:TetR/AcrR family transcriptional regulator [Catalinimonas alkaloidigena]MDF9795243.1 AcrR family transcriptional regulator [Catalinimonas alkaloidigena]